jgi:hypothetical protein
MASIEIGVGSAGTPSALELTELIRGFDVASFEFDVEKVPEVLASHTEEHLGVASGVDPRKLKSSGWGVLFAADESPAVIEALRPLLDWRKAQAGPLYREYAGEAGYTEDSKRTFLGDAGGLGLVDPKLNGIPYYLLFVGTPAQIPYNFQYLVDVQYAVGRIHFDTPAEYRLYAENVVAAEKKQLVLARKAAFYGTANENDSTTQSSRTGLIEPLAKYVGEEALEEGPKWEVACPPAEAVTKAGLVGLVSDAPALVMVATHGAAFPVEEAADQRRFNGALLSQDHAFPARGEEKPMLLEAFLTARDVPANARLHGSIFLMFACFGGGTPKFEDFTKPGEERRQLAEKAFLAALPKRLLTGGALAVIAHVERAWTTSFETKAGRNQLQTFRSPLRELLVGSPVGFAMEAFNLKWAELAAKLAEQIKNDGENSNRPADHVGLRGTWEEMHDARNFCVIGDPAVRLVTGDVESGPVEIERNPVSEEILKRAVATESEEEEEKEAKSFDTPIQLNISGRGTVVNGSTGGTLENLVTRIGATMEAVVNGLTTVEVATYVSDNVANVEFKDGKFVGAKLRARTQFGLDGKMVNLVPETDGKLDEALWGVHMASVDKAVANRSEMIKLAATAASSLLSAIKVK